MAENRKAMLGEVNAISITSPDLEMSLEFYQKLGFSEVYRADFPFPWIQVSDGALLLMLRKNPVPMCSLTYFTKEIHEVVASLSSVGITCSQMTQSSDMIQRFHMLSPDGLNIVLVSYVDGFFQPPGPTMIHMHQQDYFNPEKYVNKTCGLFGEFAHPVNDLEISIAFWEKLGFKVMSKFTTPYPWAIITDQLAVIGLHQTKKFSYPAITFFASDMRAKIENLKNAGLEDFPVDIPPNGNLVLTTPEKQHINLYSLGM